MSAKVASEFLKTVDSLVLRNTPVPKETLVSTVSVWRGKYRQKQCYKDYAQPTSRLVITQTLHIQCLISK